MTRLFVDAHEVPYPLAGFATVDEVVRHVEENHLPPDCVIRQINVDGNPLHVEELAGEARSGCGCIGSRNSIEVITGTIWEVAAESVEAAEEYLSRVEPAISRLAAAHRGTPDPRESACLCELYEGLFWLSLLVDRLESAFRVNLRGREVQGASFCEHHRRLSSIVARLIEAQEAGHHGETAILLESEILPLIPVWRMMFREIVQGILKPH